MDQNDIVNNIIEYISIENIYYFSLVNKKYNYIFNQYSTTKEFESMYYNYINDIIINFDYIYKKSSERFYKKFHNKLQKKVYINWTIFCKCPSERQKFLLLQTITNGNLMNKCINWPFFCECPSEKQMFSLLQIIINKNLINKCIDFIKEFEKKEKNVYLECVDIYKKLLCGNPNKNIYIYSINWSEIIKKNTLNDEFLIYLIDLPKRYPNIINMIDYVNISKYQSLSDVTIHKYLEFYQHEDFYEYVGFDDSGNIWTNISKCQKLSYKTIEEFKNELNWTLLCKSQKINNKIIKNNPHKVNWNNISLHQKLSEKLIEEYKNNINFDLLSSNKNIYLSDKFIQKYSNKLDWSSLVMRKLSKNILKENIDNIANDKYITRDYFFEKHHLDVYTLEKIVSKISMNKHIWKSISQHQKLNEQFILKYSQCLDWNLISRYQKLRKNFIVDKISWDSISAYQKLDELFIEKYKDFIIWNKLNTYKYSEKFIEKYNEKLDLTKCSFYKEMSPDFINKFGHKMGTENLSLWQNPSFEYINNNKNNINFSGLVSREKYSEFVLKYHCFFEKNKIMSSNGKEISIHALLKLPILTKFIDIEYVIDNYIDCYVDCIALCIYQQLSEYIIRKYREKLQWKEISRFQNMSEEFIKEFSYLIDFKELNKNKKINRQLINKINCLLQ